MRAIHVILGIVIVMNAGCNTGPTKNTTATSLADTGSSAKTNPEPVRSTLNDAGTQMLMGTVKQYYALKNALVATKAAGATEAAGQLATEAGKLGLFLQNDTANGMAAKPYIDTVVGQSRELAAISDESCEKQRLAFGTLSRAMYGLLKTVNLKNAGVYHEYCPMAFNEKGATWLSDDPDIKNPYFGKKMMECGEVLDSLK